MAVLRIICAEERQFLTEKNCLLEDNVYLDCFRFG